MADDFDKSKIIAALRAKGVSDKEISKLYGPLPPPVKLNPNSAKAKAHQKKNAWKYDNKHIREKRMEDIDPDYEPVEELRKKTGKKPSKPRISRKKPKPKPKPKPKFNWTPSAEARLKALYEAGYSTAEMAKEFGLTTDAITGKLARLKSSGWKAQVGTSHTPIPTPSSKKGGKLNATSKKVLADALESSFGVVGRYFAKRWGLVEDKKSGGGGGGKDVTAAVVKANQEVVSSLIKLDRTLRRGNASVNKALGVATAKMTDAVNNMIDVVRKQQTTDRLEGGGEGGGGPAGPAGGGMGKGGLAGVLAAVLGGAALAALTSNRTDASVDPSDMANDDEDTIRQDNEPDSTPQTPEVEIKVKELTFEADEIVFEADEFKFPGGSGPGQAGTTPKTPAPGAGPPGGPTGEGGGDGSPVPGGDAMGGSNNNDDLVKSFKKDAEKGKAGPVFPPPNGNKPSGIENIDTQGPSGDIGTKPSYHMPETDAMGNAITTTEGDAAEQASKGTGPIAGPGWVGSGKYKAPAGTAPSVGGDLDRAKFEQMFKGTPLAGSYDKVVQEAQKNNIPPSLMAGVMAHETGKGTSHMLRSRNNPAGLMDPKTGMATGKNFDSIDEGLESAAKTIAKNYERGGRTVEGMGKRYAPVGAANDPTGLNSSWAAGVNKYQRGLSAAPDQAAAGKTDGGVFGKPSAAPGMTVGAPTSPEVAGSFVGSPVSGEDVPKLGMALRPPEDDEAPTKPMSNVTVSPRGEQRSDAGGGSTFDTSELLSTRGPSHFEDFPMSSEGVGA